MDKAISGFFNRLLFLLTGIKVSPENKFGKKAKKTQRTNDKLWAKVVQEVKRGSSGGKKGQWSARKAQLAVKLYKQKGGGYSGPRSKSNKLTKWTKEDWGTKSGRKSIVGSKASGERYLPKKARDALTKAEYKKTSDKKRKDTKKGKQYSKQSAKIAKKVSNHR
jgi:hypothetical protein